MMRGSGGRRLVWLAALVVCPALAQAQPITFPTTMESWEGQFTVRVQPTLLRAADDPTERNRAFTDWNTRFIGMYGWSPRTTLIGTIPFTSRQFQADGQSFQTHGVGDAILLWRRNIHTVHRPRYSRNVAPLLGIKLPTGRARAAGFPRHLTPGSGSVDFSAGLTMREAEVGRPHRFLSAQYWRTTASKGYRRGDRFIADAAVKLPWQSWETPEGELVEVSPVLEAHVGWERRHTQDGAAAGETGGTTLSLTPGLVYTRHRLIAELAVQVPVIQRLSDGQLRGGYRLVAGLWWNF